MIKKVIASTILLCLFIAIPLSLMGFTRVEIGAPFLAFLKNCNREVSSFKIEIPDIPMIPMLDNVSGFLAVIRVLIVFVNGISSFLNIMINVINVIIQMCQFIFVIIKNLIKFKDNLTPYVPNP